MEASVSDLEKERNALILEVAKMRRTYPRKIIQMDKKRQNNKLAELLSTEFSQHDIQCQLKDYKKRKYPNQDIQIPDWERDLKNAKQVLKALEEKEAILEERICNSVNVRDLLNKDRFVPVHAEQLRRSQDA